MSTPLLHYALTTEPFPLQASPDTANPNIATLTIVVSNPTPSKHVTLHGLAFKLPVGGDDDDLTDDATNIGPVAPKGWILCATKKGAGTVEYVFVPPGGDCNNPQGGNISVGAEGLVFVFNAVPINTQPGTAEIKVMEGSTGNPTQSLYATKFPDGWGSVAFWLDPPDVPYHGSTTLHWAGPSGATYTIEYYTPQTGVVNVPAPGQPALSNHGQYPAQGAPPLTLDQATVFTLNVEETLKGRSYRAQEQKTAVVQVPAPSIDPFTATPSIVSAHDPQSVCLQWTTTNVSEFVIGNVGNFSGERAAAGHAVVTPTVAPPISVVTYLATAYGLPGYTGPPAFAETSVLCTWSLTSAWLDVWIEFNQNDPDCVLGSIVLPDGRHALDLFLVVSGTNIQRELFVLPASGVQMATFDYDGPRTPASAWEHAHYATGDNAMDDFGGLYSSERSDSNDCISEKVEHIGRTWGLKFPDGRLVLFWYESGQSDGKPIKTNKWRFTFGYVYYNSPPSGS